MDKQVTIAVIGCGHWGPNHIRCFSKIRGCKVKWACDRDIRRLEQVRDSLPFLLTTTDISEVMSDDEVNAVVVSTPTSTHHGITKMMLEHNRDVLCEKPLTEHVDEAEELVRIANDRERILMVGHVFLFNAGIQDLKDYVNRGALGKVYCIDATRTNLGPIRQDVNVVTDLASHDVSILNFLLGTEPVEVSARGESYIKPDVEDIAFITLAYPGKVLAHIHVSWLHPKKLRQITIVGNKKMITWDDVLTNEPPIRIYNKGVERGAREPFYKDYGEFQLLMREEEITIPPVKLSEPLMNQSLHFIECVQRRLNPISGGEFGLRVVRAINAINISLKSQGRPVLINRQDG
jgi:predicted dehydrogenase